MPTDRGSQPRLICKSGMRWMMLTCCCDDEVQCRVSCASKGDDVVYPEMAERRDEGHGPAQCATKNERPCPATQAAKSACEHMQTKLSDIPPIHIHDQMSTMRAYSKQNMHCIARQCQHDEGVPLRDAGVEVVGPCAAGNDLSNPS